MFGLGFANLAFAHLVGDWEDHLDTGGRLFQRSLSGACENVYTLTMTLHSQRPKTQKKRFNLLKTISCLKVILFNLQFYNKIKKQKPIKFVHLIFQL